MQNTIVAVMPVLQRCSLFVFSVVVLLCACGGAGSSRTLPGTWKVQHVEVNTPELSPVLVEAAHQMLMGAEYDFKADGTFELRMSGDVDRGTWRLEEDNQRIVLTYSAEVGDEEHRLEHFGSATMTWVSNIPELGTIRQDMAKQ